MTTLPRACATMDSRAGAIVAGGQQRRRTPTAETRQPDRMAGLSLSRAGSALRQLMLNSALVAAVTLAAEAVKR
jgi:hypothetical protein